MGAIDRFADLAIGARGNVDVHKWLLRGTGVWQATKRATARHLADGGLRPSLTLNRHVGGRAKVLLELVDIGCVVHSRASVWQVTLAPGLSGVLVLSRPELPGGLSLLLERLLLLSVGIANLDLQVFAVGLNRVVVERLDDLFAGITGLETGIGQWRCRRVRMIPRHSPSKANATAVAILVPQDARRGDIVRGKELCELVLVHRLRQVRDVEIGVALVLKGLELGIERLLSWLLASLLAKRR